MAKTSFIVFIFLGDVLISALYQTGKFYNTDTKIVWLVLIGFSLGLLSSTQGRLYSSVFYALKDTKTTLRFAIIRIFLNLGLSYCIAFLIFPRLNVPLSYHTAVLTIASVLSGWIEFHLLKNKLESVMGPIPKSYVYLKKLFSAALIAAASAWILKVTLLYYFFFHPVLIAFFVFSLFGILYFLIGFLLRIELAEQIIKKIINKLRK